jgi:hypothetical protein
MIRGVLIFILISLIMIPAIYAQESCEQIWDQCDQECKIKDWNKVTNEQRICSDACDEKNNCAHESEVNSLIYDFQIFIEDIRLKLTFDKKKKAKLNQNYAEKRSEEAKEFAKEKDRTAYTRAKDLEIKHRKGLDSISSTSSSSYDGQVETSESLGAGTTGKETEDEITSKNLDINKRISVDSIEVSTAKKEAIEEQIEIVTERVYPESTTELNLLCEINLDKRSMKASEKVNADITFDESLKGKTVYSSCDQYERYGLSGDILYPEKVDTSLSMDFKCDYGRVTVPTNYIITISDGKNVDYCVNSITLLPNEGEEGACFSEEILRDMKTSCEGKGTSYFVIPDANDCDTVYCGFPSCPSEDLLQNAWDSCITLNNTPARYSEQIEGIDWPCAQIRCSQCPRENFLKQKEAECIEGEPQRLTDFETNCNYVYCQKSNDQSQEIELIE